MPAVDRLDGVDLRIGVPDADVAKVTAAFGLDRHDARECAVHLLGGFSDDPAQRWSGATARLECASRTAQVLVQVRPVRRARLSPAWFAFHTDALHRLRIAEEWMAARHLLVAVCTAFLGPGHPVAATARRPHLDGPLMAESADGLLSGRQRDFLADCAGLTVPAGRLPLVGPIRQRTWLLSHGELGFRVCRWTADASGSAGLDLLDLEAQASAADAPFLFPALRSLARQHEVDPDAEMDPLAIRALGWASARRR